VGERLMQLVKITRLDRVLTIKPSQKEVGTQKPAI
jgi:hypothetical protein